MTTTAATAAPAWAGAEALRGLLVPLGGLTLQPDNARFHPRRNLDQIRASLEKFGQLKPVVVKDGVVVAGNGTCAAATELGWPQVAAVDLSHLSMEQARAYGIVDNRAGDLSEWDPAALEKQLDELAAFGFDVDALGFTADEVDAMLGPAQWPAVAVNADIQAAAEAGKGYQEKVVLVLSDVTVRGDLEEKLRALIAANGWGDQVALS